MTLTNGEACHERCALSAPTKQQKAIFDYWPTYPPDWKFRWQHVAMDREACEDCGRIFELTNWSGWDVHHVVALGRGGSNKADNLQLLCNECHRKAHGVADFGPNNWTPKRDARTAAPEPANPFASRIDRIKGAIEFGKCVSIRYRAFDGKVTQRTVRPITVTFPVVDGHEGSRLAVRAYCYLRHEERHFVIERIESMRVVDGPSTRDASRLGVD